MKPFGDWRSRYWWKWLHIWLHWIYKATLWSLWWTARTAFLRGSYMPVPHSSLEPAPMDTGHSWDPQSKWWYLLENSQKEMVKNAAQQLRERSEKYVKPRSEKEGTRCSRHWTSNSPTAYAEADLSWWNCGPCTTHVEAVCEGLYPMERTQKYWKSVIRKK